MKETKTTTTIQVAFQVVTNTPKEEQVKRITRKLLDIMGNHLTLEVTGDDTVLAVTEPNSIVTRKFPANSAAELVNNVGRCYPYDTASLLIDNYTVVSIQAFDKVEVTDEE